MEMNEIFEQYRVLNNKQKVLRAKIEHQSVKINLAGWGQKRKLRKEEKGWHKELAAYEEQITELVPRYLQNLTLGRFTKETFEKKKGYSVEVVDWESKDGKVLLVNQASRAFSYTDPRYFYFGQEVEAKSLLEKRVVGVIEPLSVLFESFSGFIEAVRGIPVARA